MKNYLQRLKLKATLKAVDKNIQKTKKTGLSEENKQKVVNALQELIDEKIIVGIEGIDMNKIDELETEELLELWDDILETAKSWV